MLVDVVSVEIGSCVCAGSSTAQSYSLGIEHECKHRWSPARGEERER
jgi:hypothetical protein